MSHCGGMCQGDLCCRHVAFLTSWHKTAPHTKIITFLPWTAANESLFQPTRRLAVTLKRIVGYLRTMWIFKLQWSCLVTLKAFGRKVFFFYRFVICGFANSLDRPKNKNKNVAGVTPDLRAPEGWYEAGPVLRPQQYQVAPQYKVLSTWRTGSQDVWTPTLRNFSLLALSQFFF